MKSCLDTTRRGLRGGVPSHLARVIRPSAINLVGGFLLR